MAEHSRWQTLGAALLLVAAVAVVYGPVHGHPFVSYDDPIMVASNPGLQAGLSPGGLRFAFGRFYAANWIPLTWTSYLVDFELHDLSAGGVHVTNALLHALSTLLLFAALYRMTGARWRSAAVAAVFALHPLNVETVAWASERKGVLSGVFFLLALLLYAGGGRGPHSAPRVAAVSGAMALGLLSKGVGVTLPALLLLLDYWPLRRMADASGRWDAARARRCLLEKLPLFALSLAGAVVTFFAQRSGGATASLEVLPVAARLGNAVIAYASYVVDFLFPRDLAVFYPHTESTAGAALWGSLALLVVLSALALWQIRARPWLAVGWLWFLGTLVPMIGVVQVGSQARADRYAYLTTIGLALALVWTVGEVAKRGRAARWAASGAMGVFVVSLALAASHQRALWSDPVRLFEHAIAVTRPNAIVYEHLGLSLLAAGRADEGHAQLEEALAVRPTLGVINNLAWSYATHPDPRARDPRRAVALARTAVRRSGRAPTPLDTLAAALAASRRFEDAARVQREAAALADEQGMTRMARRMRKRLELYEVGRAYVEPASKVLPP